MSATSHGLGRGLDALIPKQLVESEFDATDNVKSGQISEVAPSQIDPNPHQPRTEFNTTALKELADSIKIHGMLQPLVVTPKGNRYQLVAGERRLRAAKQLRLSKVPVVIRTFQEQQKLELAVIENVQRQDLNVIETATAYRKLIDEFSLKDTQIAERIGKDISTVRNQLRLLNLPLAVKRALAKGYISEGHARAILSIDNEAEQLKLLKEIVSNSLTVRQIENYAREQKKTPTVNKPVAVSGVTSKLLTQELSDLGKQIAEKLGSEVTIEPRAHGGRLVIRYRSGDDLKRINEKI